LVVIAFLAATAVHLYSDYQYNRKIFPGLFSRWEESFLCLKCGAEFQVPDARVGSGANPMPTGNN
jgi:hypothetical protein